MSKNINLMIKPSSSKCNLKCKYCFYHSIANSRETRDYGFMKESTLEEIIKKAISYCDGGTCSIGFQGGESTLIGLDFYIKLIDLVNTHSTSTKFNYSIQTNGTLLDENWVKFFKKNNFLVGLSLDGTKDIHNLNRVDYLNNDTFNSVFKAANLLKKYEVDFNILTVVTSTLAKKIDSCYSFFKKNNLIFLQFIPCLEPLENSSNSPSPHSITADDYGVFLNRLFDLWYKDVINGDVISIRFFDNILGAFLGYDYEACEMKGICSCQNIIESNGSVYPCDFYTYETYSIGNILNETFEDIHNKDKTINFLNKSLIKNPKCNICEFKNFCRGGCKRYSENQPDNLNFFCSSYYNFFSNSSTKFQKLANRIASK